MSGNERPIGRRFCPALAGLLLGAAFGLLPVAPAGAAFPGTNGKIAFTSNRDGNNEIYAMSPVGANQTRLTTNPADELKPAWQPVPEPSALAGLLSGVAGLAGLGSRRRRARLA